MAESSDKKDPYSNKSTGGHAGEGIIINQHGQAKEVTDGDTIITPDGTELPAPPRKRELQKNQVDKDSPALDPN